MMLFHNGAGPDFDLNVDKKEGDLRPHLR